MNTEFWFFIHTWMSTTLHIFLISAPNGHEWSNSYIKCFIAMEILRGILRRSCRSGPKACLYAIKSQPLPEMVQPTARLKNTCAIRGSHRFDMASFNSKRTYCKDKAIKYGFEHKIEKDKWKGMEVK